MATKIQKILFTEDFDGKKDTGTLNAILDELYNRVDNLTTETTTALSEILPAPASGKFVFGGMFHTTTVTGVFPTSEIHYVPFITGSAFVADRIGIVTTIGGASSAVELGLYNSANGFPTTRIATYGTVSTASAAFNTITISQNLEANRLYFMAVVRSGGGSDPTVRLFQGVTWLPFSVASNTSGPPSTRYQETGTSLPSTASAVRGSAGGTTPVLGWRAQ